MRILIIDNSAIVDFNGKFTIYKLTGEFGRELVDLGNKVEFFQLCRKSNSTISTFDLKKNHIQVTISKSFSSKIVQYIIAYARGFWRVLKNDFVYIYYPNSFCYLALLSKLLGKKYGLYIRGQRGIDSKLSNILYKYADTIFTVSEKFTEEINIQIPGRKANTIKPMISFTSQDIKKNRIYTKTNDFKLLFLGRIDKEKGLFELLEAIKRIKENYSIRFTLELVGNGSDMDSLKQKVCELGISSYVSFTGPIMDIDKIKQKYIQSDIYILPTYHEGFPRTLYEAMIFGTPIITTFVGGIPSLMKDNFNCLKIDVKSVNRIIEKLIYLMNNYSSIAETMSAKATETITEIMNIKRLSHAQHLNQIITKKN